MEQDRRLLSRVLGRWPLARTMRQAVLIALLATVIGFTLNHFRSEPLALKADWSPEARLTSKFGKNILISLDEAKEKFFSGSALFIDARSPELFREGHIQGARNLTIAAFDRQAYEMLLDLPEDTLIVTYCDGEECTLSQEVALKLKEIGFENIRVLHNGWTVWKSHHLPSQGGGEHGS